MGRDNVMYFTGISFDVGGFVIRVKEFGKVAHLEISGVVRGNISLPIEPNIDSKAVFDDISCDRNTFWRKFCTQKPPTFNSSSIVPHLCGH